MDEKNLMDKSAIKELIRETVKETIAEITTLDNKKLIELMEDALLVELMENDKDEDYIDGKEYHKMLKARIDKETDDNNFHIIGESEMRELAKDKAINNRHTTLNKK